VTLSVRGVEAGDRDRLLDWRNRQRVREMSLDDRQITAGEHQQWFEGLIEKDVADMLVVEVSSEPVGVVRLESVDEPTGLGSWGVHLGTDALLPGVGASLPVIALGLGFGRFRLRRMWAQALTTNKNIRGVHRRLGIVEEGVLRDHVRRDSGELIDVHNYGVLATEWPAVRERALALLPKAVGSDLTTILRGLGARSTSQAGE